MTGTTAAPAGGITRVNAAGRAGLAVRMFAVGIVGALQAGARKQEGRALHGAGAGVEPGSASTEWERQA